MSRSTRRAGIAVALVAGLAAAAAWLGAGSAFPPSPARAADSPAPSASPLATASPTPRATASATPRATASPSPRTSASPSPRATASPSPRPTATASPSPSLAPIREATVVVKPNQPMFDTGVDVLATDVIHIVATGTVQLIPGDKRSIVDADGEPGRLSGCDPEVYCGTLMASLTPTRGWTRAGTTALIPSGTAGRLYLRVNAADPGRATGSFEVKIRAGRQALLGVASPTPAGISRDAVLPGGGGAAGPTAPLLDLVVAAVLAGIGALLGSLAARRLLSRRPGTASSDPTTAT